MEQRGQTTERERPWNEKEKAAQDWVAGQAHSVAQTAREGVEAATGRVQGAIEQTRQSVDQAMGYVQDTVDQARQKVAEYKDAGFDRMKDDVIWYTRQQPITALLIAAGAGLLVGLMTSMTRR